MLMALALGALIGIVVGALVYLGMGLNVWTVMHSGRSPEEIQRYYQSMLVVPPVAGLTAAGAGYFFLRSKAARRK